MWPFRTVTEPKRFRCPSACALSLVAQPHSGYTDQSGICAKTTIRAAGGLALEIGRKPFDLVGAQRAEALLHSYVREPDEVDIFVIEAIPAPAFGFFAVALKILLAIVCRSVVFARHIKDLLRLRALEHLVERVVFLRLWRNESNRRYE